MANPKIKAFVEYVVCGYYEDHSSANKKFLQIRRDELAATIGVGLGSSQKKQLRDVCRMNDIAMAELKKEFIFFAPGDIKKSTIDLNSKEVKRLTDQYSKMTPAAAKKDYALRKF
jgi:hypothetical protein